MSRSILIIGAGIAGLSAGCYAQMNGYQSQIFEMHSIPGGLCTAWKRKGYTFDISAHILTGSKQGSFYRMWQQLGAVQGRQMVDHPELVRVESGDKGLTVSCDLDRLEQDMLALSPADAPHIKELIGLIRKCANLDMPMDKAQDLWNPLDYLKMAMSAAPMMSLMRKYQGVSLQSWLSRVSNPLLREAIRVTIDAPSWPMPDYPMAAYGIALASMMFGNASTPIGGSQSLVFAIARRYEALGGTFHYRSRVEKVLVENGQAVGVRLADGSEHRADVVISAADGHTTLHNMLDGRYLSDEIHRNYQQWQPVLPQVQVMLGVARDVSAEPPYLAYVLRRPIQIAGEERGWLGVRHFCFDPTMAPVGKSVVQVWYPTRFDYWEALASERDRYEAEKQQIAEATLGALEERWPGISADVQVVDVPTPLTYVRYTGNWQGSPDGWYMTTTSMGKRMPKTLPGLGGFYMVGQWVSPYAGMPMSALSGRDAIQMLCKKEGRRFVTSQP